MKYARAIIFLLILSVMYCSVSKVFLKKGRDYERQVRFFEQNENYDIISIGSSFVYFTMNPFVLYEECGLRAYNLGSPIQTVEMSYFYAKRALENAHPKLLVIGATLFVYSAGRKANTDAFVHLGSDAFPFGLDKMMMLSACKLPNDLETYLLPLMKCHSRWKELREEDFDRTKGWDSGALLNGLDISARTITECFTVRDVSSELPSPVGEENLSFLRKFKELADAHGCKLLLIASPQKPWPVKLRLRRYAELFLKAKEMGIDVIDLGAEAEELGLIVGEDFLDSVHMNVLGSEKCTRRISRFIKERYEFSVPVLSNVERRKYESLCERYHKQRDDAVEREAIRRKKARKELDAGGGPDRHS